MSAYAGPIIDVDVHNRPKHESELIAYLPKRWREYAAGRGGTGNGSITPPAPTWGSLATDSGRRSDMFEDDGVLPGHSYDMLKKELLDRYDYRKCVLTHDVGQWSAHLNQYFTREICRAANDWMIESWLPKDELFLGQIVASWAEPEEAAKEIRRVGANPRMVSVLFTANPLGRPLGDPLFHPVFEAAEELGLAITLHPPGVDRPPSAAVAGSGGSFASTIESAALISQQAMHYLASLVTHGVFEKYPRLQVLVLEYGVAWLPSLLWRLDEEYGRLRLESPWVKRWPSEYLRTHVKIGTQPLEESPAKAVKVVDLLQTVDGIEDMLCFATDYPHWSMDEPTYIARILPKSWHKKVFCENACAIHGLAVPTGDQAAAKAC